MDNVLDTMVKDDGNYHQLRGSSDEVKRQVKEKLVEHGFAAKVTLSLSQHK